MAKPSLKDLMAKRNPLLQTEREVIQPADLYTSPQVDKTTNTQVEKSASREAGVTTTPPINIPVSQPIGKYTTHLRRETVKMIKREAVESERKDYEIVQEALDRYFKAKTKQEGSK